MTIYLRTQENRTVVDIELSNGKNGLDLRSAVSIHEYSKILLNSTVHMAEDLINDFSELDELRGWFWEVYIEMASEPPTFEKALKGVKEKISPIADKYNLNIITD